MTQKANLIKASLKEAVARSGVMLWEKGLSPGADFGDTSLRDIETGYIYILPRPSERQPIRNWGYITREDVVVINLNNEIVDDSGSYPTLAVPIHLHIYKSRPEVNAIVHSHGKWSPVFAGLRRDVPVITIDNLRVLGGNVINCVGFGRADSEDYAVKVVKALGRHLNAIIMANHGAVCLGVDLEEAFFVANILERASKQAVYGAMIARSVPKPIDDRVSSALLEEM